MRLSVGYGTDGENLLFDIGQDDSLCPMLLKGAYLSLTLRRYTSYQAREPQDEKIAVGREGCSDSRNPV